MEEFAGREPVGMNHRHIFKAKANDELSTLLIWQDDVKNGGWQIRLNGKGLGRLATYETRLFTHWKCLLELYSTGRMYWKS